MANKLSDVRLLSSKMKNVQLSNKENVVTGKPAGLAEKSSTLVAGLNAPQRVPIVANTFHSKPNAASNLGKTALINSATTASSFSKAYPPVSSSSLGKPASNDASEVNRGAEPLEETSAALSSSSLDKQQAGRRRWQLSDFDIGRPLGM
eukprot:Sdes_comp19597_c0_seq2m11325